MTILHSTPLPWVTFVLQVHPHNALSVNVVDRTTSRTSPHSTPSHCLGLHFFYKYSILLFTSLSWVMFLLQVHNHTALYVTALCPISVANTSPYSTLRHCPVPHFDTLRHWPRFLCKYITIAYSTSLRITSSTSASLYCTSPPFVKHFTSASPYSNLRDCHWSHFCYKHIAILYVVSHFSSSNLFYKCITILHSMPSLLVALLQVHHHILLCSHFIYNYITVAESTSLPWVTLLLPVHRHNVLHSTALGHTSTCTSPYWTLRHCLGSYFFYISITILRSTSLLWITFLIAVHHHTAFYVTTTGTITTTSMSPYYILCHCRVSNFFCKYSNSNSK